MNGLVIPEINDKLKTRAGYLDIYWVTEDSRGVAAKAVNDIPGWWFFGKKQI